MIILLFTIVRLSLCHRIESPRQNTNGIATNIPSSGRQLSSGSSTRYPSILKEIPVNENGLNSYSDTDMEERLRIDIMKQQILDRLGLAREPNVTVDRQAIPKPLKDVIAKMDVQEMMQGDQPLKKEKSRTTQITVFGKQVDSAGTSASYSFSLNTKNTPDIVAAATLWLYKIPDPGDGPLNQTLVLTEVKRKKSGKFHSKKLHRQTISTAVKEGWIKVDLKHRVGHWIQKTHARVEFIVKMSCKTCLTLSNPIQDAGQNRPLIQIDFRKQKHHRTRRSVPKNLCKRHKLTIDFKADGWDWILYPETLDLYYCKGTCVGQSSLKFTHTTFMRGKGISTCCNPSSMSSLSMIYKDDQGLFYNSIMEDMIVETCGCS